MVTIPRSSLPGVTSLSLASVLLLLVVPARGQSPQSPPASDTNPLVALTLETGRPGSTDSDGVVWLRGSEARQQLLVTGRLRDGRLVDYTRHVHYESRPAGIVSIDKTGFVTPLANGSVRVTAGIDQGPGAGTRLSVGDIGQSRRVNFPQRDRSDLYQVGMQQRRLPRQGFGSKRFQIVAVRFRAPGRLRVSGHRGTGTPTVSGRARAEPAPAQGNGVGPSRRRASGRAELSGLRPALPLDQAGHALRGAQ